MRRPVMVLYGKSVCDNSVRDTFLSYLREHPPLI